MNIKRNFLNKHKYIRLVKYNSDMSVTVNYIKRDVFNKNNEILINPKHVYNFNGYTTIILTSNSQESINPLDFDSKYSAKDYQNAIRTKVVSDVFETLKPDKFDKVMALLFLNGLQLLAIGYLIYMLVEV